MATGTPPFLLKLRYFITVRKQVSMTGKEFTRTYDNDKIIN